MSCDNHRQFLLDLSAQKRSYEFLHGAMSLIEQYPDDAAIRLLAVRHFAALGLFGPAVELTDERPDLVAQAPDLAPLLRVLRTQPTGRVPWDACAPVFDRNLAAVCDRFSTCKSLEPQIRDSLHDLDLFRCKDGNYLLSRRPASGRRQWLPSIMDWSELISNFDFGFLPDKDALVCIPYLIEGVAFGHLLRRVYEDTATLRMSYTPRVHLLERNLAQFAVWLNLDAHRVMLRDERFHLWLGDHAADDFLAFHRSRPTEVAPRFVLRQPAWGPARESVGQQAIDKLAGESARRAARSARAIRNRLTGRDQAAWYAERFRQRALRPLRILGVTNRFSTFVRHSMNDIQDAVCELGHEFRLLIQPDDHTPSLPGDYVLQQIEDFMPHLILIIDQNRKEHGDLFDLPIPFCNWIQDDVPTLFGPGCGADLHPYDLVVGMIGHRKAASSGYPRDQWKSLPTPVSLRKFSNAPISSADRRTHECDISFVTHMSTTQDELLRQMQARCVEPEARRLLAAQCDDIGPRIASGWLPGSAPQTIAWIQQLAHDLGLNVSDSDANRIRQQFTDPLINLHFRQQVLEWAADMGLNIRIYGRGWEKHPTLARYARGVADHGRHLRCIYQASKINIQAVSTGAVHQRLLEGLAAGGFFIIRRTPGDALGSLDAFVTRRCVALNIRSEDELWSTPDESLARDIRTLHDALFAPAPFYPGYVTDLYDAADRGFSMLAGALLPHYEKVSFGTRPEFEQAVSRFLNDPDARRDVTAAQRDAVIRRFSYPAVLEHILTFAEDRFAAQSTPQAGQSRMIVR